MQLVRFLVSALWAVCATAYGLRGAYERALYFQIYMLEDMLDIPEVADGSPYEVAANCPGQARTGAMTKKRRCTLGQFVDHIWRGTPTPQGSQFFDLKPLAANVKWPSDGTTSSLSTSQVQALLMNAADERGKIFGRKEYIVQPDGGRHEVKNFGYTGNVDEKGKLWPNYDMPDGMAAYLKSIQYIADRADTLVGKWNKALSDGDLHIGDNDKDHANYDRDTKANNKVKTYVSEAQTAAEFAHEFRKQSLYDFLYQKGDFKSKFGGVTPVWKDVASGRPEAVGSWKEMDKDQTIAKLQENKPAGGGLCEQCARDLYDSVWDTVKSGEGYSGHHAAIEAIDGARNKLNQISVGCLS